MRSTTSLRTGIAGLEVFSSYHDEAATKRLYQFCVERDLLMTAGSDFYGPSVKPDLQPGDVVGGYDFWRN